MRSLFLLFLLLFLGIESFAQTTQEDMVESWRNAGTDSLDAKNGFRSYKFGTSIASIKGMQQIESAGDSKYYRLINEKLKIGEASLTKIAYGFYKGQFSSVLIDVNGDSNCDEVLTVLKSQYGEGKKLGGSVNWFGRKVTLTCSVNYKTHHSTIIFSSNELAEREKSDRLRKAASDL
jgi:hypothetical protein